MSFLLGSDIATNVMALKPYTLRIFQFLCEQEFRQGLADSPVLVPLDQGSGLEVKQSLWSHPRLHCVKLHF